MSFRHVWDADKAKIEVEHSDDFKLRFRVKVRGSWVVRSFRLKPDDFSAIRSELGAPDEKHELGMKL